RSASRLGILPCRAAFSCSTLATAAVSCDLSFQSHPQQTAKAAEIAHGIQPKENADRRGASMAGTSRLICWNTDCRITSGALCCGTDVANIVEALSSSVTKAASSG